jgi:two-component system, cell cycle sensor histidine kinase and response regulator CckA
VENKMNDFAKNIIPMNKGSLTYVSGAKRMTDERIPGVLLVEDDAYMMEMNRRILQREGFRVFEAASEQTALWLWQRHQPEIDVVFTDVMIPERTTGVDLVRKLRQQRPNLRVVYTSGFGPELAGLDMMTESVCFIQKPYSLRQMINGIVEALEMPLQTALTRAEIARCVA